ncbi:MAG: serine hydrolase [Clostridiales bacterium]|nr:serine hydrolase [Clostridiales bacterium]
MISEFTLFTFETSTPEAVGIDSAAIAEFIKSVNTDKTVVQGYMLYRHGKLVASSIAAPYRFSDKRHVYSASKTFTSTAVGIAVDEGLLSVEDSVISFFPDELPDTISENLAAMKVKHLLSMNTGHDTDTLGRVVSREPNWVKRFLALPIEHKPGTHFIYNTPATYMLSAIITKLTGMYLVDYLRTRLFNPLGIDDVWWEKSREEISDGGWGIHVSPEDMLKLGVLYLNKGVWNGKRILSEKWIEEASSVHSDTSSNANSDWQLGYGYQIWRCRHDSYRADGAYGQYIVVSPDKDAVAVIISESSCMEKVLDIYWDTIHASMSDSPLPELSASCDIQLPPAAELPEHSDISIVPEKYKLSENRFGITDISLRIVDDILLMKLYGEHICAVEIACGNGRWEYNKISVCPLIPAAFLDVLAYGVRAEIAAAYGEKDGMIHISLQFVSTPHGMTIDIDQNKRSFVITRRLNHDVAPIELTLA